MNASRFSGGLAVVKDNFMIYMGGMNLGSAHQSVYLQNRLIGNHMLTC